MTDVRKIDYYMSLFYPIKIYYIRGKVGKGYYLAYYPDFGVSVCSATGSTVAEAVKILGEVKKEVIVFLVKSKRLVPKPEQPPFFTLLQ